MAGSVPAKATESKGKLVEEQTTHTIGIDSPPSDKDTVWLRISYIDEEGTKAFSSRKRKHRKEDFLDRIRAHGEGTKEHRSRKKAKMTNPLSRRSSSRRSSAASTASSRSMPNSALAGPGSATIAEESGELPPLAPNVRSPLTGGGGMTGLSSFSQSAGGGGGGGGHNTLHRTNSTFGPEENDFSEEKLAERLLEHALFADFDRDVIRAVVDGMHLRSYQANDAIIHQGEEGKAMFYLERGTAKYCTDGGETELGKITEGRFFGELGILFGKPRRASVYAVTRCLVFVLSVDNVRKVMAQHADFAAALQREAEERQFLITRAEKPEGSLAMVDQYGYPVQRSAEIEGFQAGPLRQQLALVPIFQNCSADLLHKLCVECMEVLRVSEGRNIVEAGTEAKSLYILIEGVAEVIKRYNVVKGELLQGDETEEEQAEILSRIIPGSERRSIDHNPPYNDSSAASSNSTTGPGRVWVTVEQPVAILQAGEYFGEYTILEQSDVHVSTVRAVEYCLLFKLPRDKFRACMRKYCHDDSDTEQAIYSAMRQVSKERHDLWMVGAEGEKYPVTSTAAEAVTASPALSSAASMSQVAPIVLGNSSLSLGAADSQTHISTSSPDVVGSAGGEGGSNGSPRGVASAIGSGGSGSPHRGSPRGASCSPRRASGSPRRLARDRSLGSSTSQSFTDIDRRDRMAMRHSRSRSRSVSRSATRAAIGRSPPITRFDSDSSSGSRAALVQLEGSEPNLATGGKGAKSETGPGAGTAVSPVELRNSLMEVVNEGKTLPTAVAAARQDSTGSGLGSGAAVGITNPQFSIDEAANLQGNEGQLEGIPGHMHGAAFGAQGDGLLSPDSLSSASFSPKGMRSLTLQPGIDYIDVGEASPTLDLSTQDIRTSSPTALENEELTRAPRPSLALKSTALKAAQFTDDAAAVPTPRVTPSVEKDSMDVEPSAPQQQATQGQAQPREPQQPGQSSGPNRDRVRELKGMARRKRRASVAVWNPKILEEEEDLKRKQDRTKGVSSATGSNRGSRVSSLDKHAATAVQTVVQKEITAKEKQYDPKFGLSDDLWLRILEHVPLGSVMEARRVCKGWKKMIMTNAALFERIDFSPFNKNVNNDNMDNIVRLLPMTGCEYLNLSSCWHVGDYGISRIAKKCTNLRSLVLFSVWDLTSAGLMVITNVNPQLDYLEVSNCRKLTDEAIVHTVKTCKELRHLELSYCKSLGDASLQAIVEHCHNLRVLNLQRCVGMSAEGFAIFRKHSLPLLERAEFSDLLAINDELILFMVRNMPKLKRLNLAFCSNITDEALVSIAAFCHELEELDLSCVGANITDEGIAELTEGKCRDTLRFISLRNCPQVTNASVLALDESCTRLRTINVSNCKLVTPAVAQQCQCVEVVLISQQGNKSPVPGQNLSSTLQRHHSTPAVSAAALEIMNSAMVGQASEKGSLRRSHTGTTPTPKSTTDLGNSSRGAIGAATPIVTRLTPANEEDEADEELFIERSEEDPSRLGRTRSGTVASGALQALSTSASREGLDKM
eukprot:Clim_evm5s46 gene=Clim_evmTU5s46